MGDIALNLELNKDNMREEKNNFTLKLICKYPNQAKINNIYKSKYIKMAQLRKSIKAKT